METEGANRFAPFSYIELRVIRFALHSFSPSTPNGGDAGDLFVLNFLRAELTEEVQGELEKRIGTNKGKEDITAISGKPSGPRPPTTPSKPRKGVKSMSHGDLYERAKTTIDELYSDASVSLETIRSSLEALVGHTTSKVHALDADESAMGASEPPKEGTWVRRSGPDRGWGRFIYHKCTGCNMPCRVWEVELDKRCSRCGRPASE